MKKMRIAFYALLLFFPLFVSFNSPAQNILIADSVICRPFDTVVLSVEISNTQQFVSFQFDLQIPEMATYIATSLQLSQRSENHVVTGNLTEENSIRILAYSPNNSAFLGNSGSILSFKIVIGDIQGEYPLGISSAVIGDSLSRNILNGIQNGNLSISPLGINDNINAIPINNVKVFPNPVNVNSSIEFSLDYRSFIRIILIDGKGQQLFSEELGEFNDGTQRIRLPEKILSVMNPFAIYYLGLGVIQYKKIQPAVFVKIIQ